MEEEPAETEKKRSVSRAKESSVAKIEIGESFRASEC